MAPRGGGIDQDTKCVQGCEGPLAYTRSLVRRGDSRIPGPVPPWTHVIRNGVPSIRQCPEVNGRQLRTFPLSALAIPEGGRFCQDFRTLKPLLQERRRDVEEKCLRRIARWRAATRRSARGRRHWPELNFIKLAFRGGGWWGLKSREAIQAHRAFAQFMHLYDILQKAGPRLLRPRPSRDKVSA